MKIFVIFTGGTIGCSEQGTVSLDGGAADLLVSEYLRVYGDCEFECAAPLYTLSENMTSAKWQRLYDYIRSADFSPYDGVILTHGTDTLSYTAAFLGLALADIPFPLVITGSNHAIGSENSNALENFRSAVLLAQTGVSGVYAAYDGKYYLGTDICEADGLTDSYGGRVCGRCDGEKALLDMSIAAKMPPKTEISVSEKEIIMIKPYPNMRYGRIRTDGAAAVLHLLYHSATACTEDGYSLCGFAESSDVPIYAAPFKRGAVPYSTTAEILASGVKPLYGMTPETAYALLTIAYGQGGMPPDEYISQYQAE